MKVEAYWTVVERHSAVLEVDDDFDPDEALSSDELAAVEDGNSFNECADRYLERWEKVDDSEPDPVRERVVALVGDLSDTLSDPTQAWDIAVADFNDNLIYLAKKGRTDG